LNPDVRVLCPVCFEPLSPLGASYRCQRGHNFDKAREGYLSLLHGGGDFKLVGDDKRMVDARVRVHLLPPYDELAEAMAAVTQIDDGNPLVLDIGCGDGCFLSRVIERSAGPRIGIGADISKVALGRAERLYPGLSFIRTDAVRSRLPFRDQSIGLVMSVFAPRPTNEVWRTLKEEGRWLVVTANHDHLKEVREFLPLAAIGEGKLEEAAGALFSVQTSSELRSERTLAKEDLRSIIEMSPSVFRLRREYGEDWGNLVPDNLRTTFSFSISLLRKNPRG